MGWKEETDYQKLNGMSKYPTSGKRSVGKVLFVIFVIAILIGALFVISTPAGQSFLSEIGGR